jgi:hypothetical protein
LVSIWDMVLMILLEMETLKDGNTQSSLEDDN